MQHSKQVTSIAIVFFIGSLTFFSSAKASHLFLHNILMPTALADDDNEGENNRESRNTVVIPPADPSPAPATTPTVSPAANTPTQTNIPKPKKVKVAKVAAPVEQAVTHQTVTKLITVTDPGYDIDTDGDKLVDAIDPNPTQPETEYFTDIDGDGVPNALDEHHDEDDFAYISAITTDTNQN